MWNTKVVLLECEEKVMTLQHFVLELPSTKGPFKKRTRLRRARLEPEHVTLIPHFRTAEVLGIFRFQSLMASSVILRFTKQTHSTIRCMPPSEVQTGSTSNITHRSTRFKVHASNPCKTPPINAGQLNVPRRINMQCCR